jgi:hypothetical protein
MRIPRQGCRRASLRRHLPPPQGGLPVTARWQWAQRAAIRIGAGIVTAVLAGIVGAVILYQTSVQPGAAIVKAVFERGQLVTPPAGFAQVARTVTEQSVTVPTSRAHGLPRHLHAGWRRGHDSPGHPVDPRRRLHLQLAGDGGRLRDHARARRVHRREPGLQPGTRIRVPGAGTAGQRRTAVSARANLP